MTNLTKQTIALSKLNSLVLPEGSINVEKVDQLQQEHMVLTFQAELVKFGYILSAKALSAICDLTTNELVKLYNEVVPFLKELKGSNVKHKPMYQNFPNQVIEMDVREMYAIACLHYWTYGQWKPDFDELPREFQPDGKLVQIDLVSDVQFYSIAQSILLSKDSISENDKNIIKWFIEFHYTRIEPFFNQISYKETLCFVAGALLEQGKSILSLIKDTTDVLRIATYLSGGDVSLKDNTKFKSLPRRLRRNLLYTLNRVIREEDVMHHKEKWVHLFHSLHVGEYDLGKIKNIAKKIRNHIKIETFNSKIEQLLLEKNYVLSAEYLKKRPGLLVRNIDLLLRESENPAQKTILAIFSDIVDQVPTRMLVQLLGNLKGRNDPKLKRFIFSKNVNKVYVLNKYIPSLETDIVNSLVATIEDSLVKRFKELSELGNVWIDPELMLCPLPTQMRTASKGVFECARGTQFQLSKEAKTIRLFIYWKGQDIDLSATFHDENFQYINHVSYTRLKASNNLAYHSGDIINAPEGASEFIDIDINKALKKGYRYVVMNVYSFSVIPFHEIETCFVGWMERKHVASNEIFDPKTVVQKIDLVAPYKVGIPVIFDLLNKKVMWTDLYGNTCFGYSYFIGEHDMIWKGGINVEANKATINDTLAAISRLPHTRYTLYELFNLHVNARGILVRNPEDADIVFGFDKEKGITPFDVNIINSEYLV